MATKGIREIAITNDSNYLIEPTLYTTVNQTSAATTFTADLDKFELFNGVTVAVKFGVTNNASATLNINGTGAKAIYYEGAAIAANKLQPKRTYIFTYNDAQWELIGDLDTNTNTTYTFESGTNGFKVTPLGGTAQTVTVTPSITNNITGTGTENYLTKFTGTNTIGNSGLITDSNNNLTIPGTIYFSSNTSTSTGKALFAYNSTYPKYGIWYKEGNPDVMAFSASGNADTTTSADFAVEGGGKLYNKGNIIPHTGNATGTVGSTKKPVYLDGGQIKEISYTIEKSVPSNAVFTDTTYSAGTGLQLSSNIFSIKDNAVRRNKLMMTDTTNYAELNDYSAADWGFTADTTADGHWYTVNTLARDKFVSDYYQCNGGETFNIQFELSSTFKGNTTSGGTDSVYIGTAVGLYCYNESTTSQGIAYSERVTADANGTVTAINSDVTIPTTARRFRVFIQSNTYGNFSGAVKIRKLKVIRVSAPKWYGDLSGNAATATSATSAITASKLGSSNIGNSETLMYLNEGTATTGNKVFTLQGGTSIPANADMNSYKTIGNYYGPGDANAKTVTNTPFGAAASNSHLSFTLKVEASLGSGTSYLRQHWRGYNSGVEAERTSTNSGTSWSTWRTKVFKNSNAVTAEGSSKKPVYVTATGQVSAIDYTIEKSVPSDAVFTDHYAWNDITGKPSTFSPSAHDHNRLSGIGRKTTVDTIAYNPSDNGCRLSWLIYDSSSRNNDATNTPSFEATVLNLPWDWGGYNGQIAISSTIRNDTRLQIRSSSSVDNGENANPRYTTNYGAWREVVTATKATKVGDTNRPVYINATGQATAITAVGASYGGTGKTTLNDSANVLINALGTGSSPLTANDYVITQYVGGGTTTTTYHRRPASKVVNATLVKAALGTVSTTAKKFLKDTGDWVQVAFNDLSGKPTTLSGYGITDAAPSVDGGYLPLSGGTMTGPITFTSQSSGFNDKNILFSSGGRLGGNTNGDVGLYAKGTLYLKPNSDTSASADDGIVLDTDGLRPYVNNNTYNLGSSSNKWRNVYGVLGEFYGYSRINITNQTVDLDSYTLSDGAARIRRYIECTNGGSANISHLPVTGFPFILDVEAIRYASDTDYITLQTFRNAHNPNNEYVRYCTNGVWGDWTTRVFTDHYAWADITSKPATATRWPAWGEVTGKPTSFTPATHTHDYLPFSYTAVDYTSTSTTMGVYPHSGVTHPVTGETEYGGLIQFGSSSATNSYHGAQLLVSSVSGATSPVHAYIRRMTSTPGWSGWSTLLDDKNYTSYAWARPSSITADQVLVSSGTAGETTLRAILNNTSAGALGWNSAGNTNTNNLRLIDVNTLAYWNGAYSGTSSNLSVLGTVTTGTWKASVIGASYIDTAIARLDSPTFTGTPKAPTAANGTSTTQIATTEFVNNTLAYANAMTFKGTLGTGGTVTALPASHNAGDTYRVITAGTWAGKYCEAGTLIICVADGTAANDADWTSVETNEDGAVIGATPTSSTDNAIVRWDGTSGRIIQNSGAKIDDDGNIVLTSGNVAITSTDNKRLSWKLSDGTMKGYFTISSGGKVGIHGCQELYFRPGDTNNAISTTTGTVLTNSAFYPYNNEGMSLGISSNRWSSLYAATSIYVGNLNFTSYNTNNKPGVYIGPEIISISQQTKAGVRGFWLIGNGQKDYARLYINALGTASTTESSSGANDGTQGAVGDVILILGNSIARGAKNTTDGLGNARGRLRLHGTTANYIDLYTQDQTTNGRAIFLPNSDHADPILVPSYDLSGAQDLNTKYNAGIYCIEDGSVTNYPSGSTAYANLLVLPYRRPQGNTKPDYALQIYGHSANRLWFRGSDANNWRAWQELVHVAANTGAGSTNTPVYIATDGTVTAVSKYLATHVAGGSEEIQIKYSTTIDYWWGVGTANENHGLYDNKAGKWILSAGAANTWTFIGNVTGNASTATKSGVTGIWLYPENNNEINFGGTNTNTTLYVGYRAKDSRAIPTKFIFGGVTGTADLQAKTVYLGSGTTSYISSTQYTGNAASASYLSTPSITTEANIEDGTRAYQGSGSGWTGSVTSMQYAGILQICGGYSRGWQIWATRGATNSLHWRNPNSDATAWTDERIILDSSNYTSYAVAKTAGVTAVTWDATNKKLTRTINGTAADVMTAAQMSTALELGTMASETATNYLKWQTTSLASTALYDFGVYVAQNTAAGSSPTGTNYYTILNIPYRKATGNTKADYGFQIGNSTANDSRLWYRTSGNDVWGSWQTIAHATTSSSNIGSARKLVYMTSAGVITAGNNTVAHFGNARKSNMNDIGRLYASTGMTSLTSTDNADTPKNGDTYTSGWHLYWDTCYQDDPNDSNAWVAQIVNKAGTNNWWVRSRGGGTITDGTAWASAWRHLVTSTEAAVGNSTTPVYIDANGAVQSCIAYSSASVDYATSAGSATTASNVTQSSSTADLARPIWFCYQENNSYILGRAGYNTNFMYNPGTKTITIGSGSLSETEYSGNAATATSASKISTKLATTTKTYLLGTATTITATAANVSLTGDTGIYLTTTAGELSAVRHSWNVSGTEKAYTTYNTTDDSIDFVFV